MMKWCILRCAGRQTLPLAASLAEDGYEVWTPVETVTKRVPRMNARREVRLPIMASYIFGAEQHLVDLLQLSAMSVKPRRGAGLMKPAHADFSVLHAFGRIPLVADKDMARLRELEVKLTPRKVAAYVIPKGRKVRVNGGICSGLQGSVIRSKPATTWVQFGHSAPFEIPTILLDMLKESDEEECNLGVASVEECVYGAEREPPRLKAA